MFHRFQKSVQEYPQNAYMKDYSEFLGTGDAALVAAVKAKLGTDTVTANEDAVKNSVAMLKAPTEVWTSGPAAE